MKELLRSVRLYSNSIYGFVTVLFASIVAIFPYNGIQPNVEGISYFIGACIVISAAIYAQYKGYPLAAVVILLFSYYSNYGSSFILSITSFDAEQIVNNATGFIIFIYLIMVIASELLFNTEIISFSLGRRHTLFLLTILFLYLSNLFILALPLMIIYIITYVMGLKLTSTAFIIGTVFPLAISYMNTIISAYRDSNLGSLGLTLLLLATFSIILLVYHIYNAIYYIKDNVA